MAVQQREEAFGRIRALVAEARELERRGRFSCRRGYSYLTDPWDQARVEALEARAGLAAHGLTLPDDLREMLLRVGPFVFADALDKAGESASLPFLWKAGVRESEAAGDPERWAEALAYDSTQEAAERAGLPSAAEWAAGTWSVDPSQGSVQLSSAGCQHLMSPRVVLVVTGPERGRLWVFDDWEFRHVPGDSEHGVGARTLVPWLRQLWIPAFEAELAEQRG